MHLRDAITRVARQMNLDAALVDSWVKQSPEYTAREDAPGAARRSGTSANKRSAEHEQGVKAREGERFTVPAGCRETCLRCV